MGSNPTQGSFFFEKRKSCPGCIYLPCFVYHVQFLSPPQDMIKHSSITERKGRLKEYFDQLSVSTVCTFIVTCVGGSKAPPIPLLPLLWKRAVWPILNIHVVHVTTMMSQFVSTYYRMCYNSLASVLSSRGKLARDNRNKTNNVRFYRSLHDLRGPRAVWASRPHPSCL